MIEYNFDGIVGPTHSYAGLSAGNLASSEHAGEIGNPRAAALQGLEKMRFVQSLGVEQAVLPPQPRPDLKALRAIGFSGNDADVLAAAAKSGPLLRLCSSASAMWTANAATVVPSCDAHDGKLHLAVANLSSMFHRSLEAPVTHAVLGRVFASPSHFVVHSPLPASDLFADEGAANHLRLATSQHTTHLFGFGRAWARLAALPEKYPARQSLEASQAVARLTRLAEHNALFWQQAPAGIDAGAFHSDVLAVGNRHFLMLHEHAFVDVRRLLGELAARLGDELSVCLASEAELPASNAVRAYPFNSQILSLPNGEMAIVAPLEALEDKLAAAFLERVVRESNPVTAVHYIDVNASMRNGGGPACLRLRVLLSDEERAAVRARVFLDAPLCDALEHWIRKHYRDRLSQADLADPALLTESQSALDELTQLLELGSVYNFQRV